MNINTRICMVVQNYFPEDPRVRKYVDTLLQNKCQVDIISLKRADLKFKDNYKGATIYRIGLPKYRGSTFRYLLEYFIFFLLASFLLNILFIKKEYAIIHVHNMPDFLVFSTIYPKILGARVILDMHEITPEFFQYKFGASHNSLSIRICRFIEYLSLSYANYVITVTNRIKEIFIKRNKIKNIDVIMNTENYIPNIKTSISNSTSEYFEMIYHGTITDLYSLDLPIKALSLIKEPGIKLRFNIFGDGLSRANLEELTKTLGLENQVVFHGKLSYKEISRVLKKMNLGILTFRRNQFIDLSFSNKLSEYINNCVPVLTTKLPSVLDYFDENDLFLCEANVESIRKKLLEIIKGNVNLEKKTVSAKRKYKKIAWDNMERKYLSIINNLSNS